MTQSPPLKLRLMGRGRDEVKDSPDGSGWREGEISEVPYKALRPDLALIKRSCRSHETGVCGHAPMGVEGRVLHLRWLQDGSGLISCIFNF